MAWQENIIADVIANRPASNDVIDGCLFFATDENIVYRNDLGGAGWVVALTAGGGGAWELVDTYDHSVDGTVSEFDVLNLDDYTEILVVFRLVTLSGSEFRSVRVSEDNGVSFLDQDGDYKHVALAGTEANGSRCAAHDTASALARSGLVRIQGLNTSVLKFAKVNRVESLASMLILSTAPVNAIRCFGVGVNITGGVIYVFGR